MKSNLIGGLVVGAIAALMAVSLLNMPTSPKTSTTTPKLGVAMTPLGKFDAPVATAIRPRSAGITVAQKGGLVRLLNDDGTISSTPIVDISTDTTSDGEQGLLGLVYSPDGTQMYLDFTDTSGKSHVDRWTLSANGIADPASRTQILSQDQPYANHNGGNVVFGPDGALYIGFGDGGSGGDPENRAQNPATYLGKIVRVDVATGDKEIFMTGLRNPWRFSFDPETRDMWIGDVGQNRWEEVDMLPAPATGSEPGGRGANLGWKLLEGTHKFSDGDTSGMTQPVWDYPHDGGNCSVTGGVMYRGTAVPKLTDKYVFADYCQGSLRVLTPHGSGRADVEQIDLTIDKPVSFGYDASGEILVVSLSGTLYRLVAA